MTESERKAEINRMFRKHNTRTTQALRALEDTLGRFPNESNSKLKVRHE